jgi:hypothetical protein
VAVAVAAVCVGAAVFLGAALGVLPGIVLALAAIAAVVMAAMFLAERVALRAPFSCAGFTRLFTTHPPTGERVYRLEGLAGYPR